MKHEWDPENPACVECGHKMDLLEGCDWDDDPEMNLCAECAVELLRKLRREVTKIVDEYAAAPGTVIVNGVQFAAKLRELLK